MNALSILIAIPIFDFAVYPILTKMNIKLTHVHKIGAGMVIMGKSPPPRCPSPF